MPPADRLIVVATRRVVSATRKPCPARVSLVWDLYALSARVAGSSAHPILPVDLSIREKNRVAMNGRVRSVGLDPMDGVEPGFGL